VRVIEAPVVEYSPARYGAIIAIGLLIAGAVLVYGVTSGDTIAIAAGAVGLLFVGLFARGTKDKVLGRGPALAREGDLLVGGELAAPLPVSATTFEIATDYEGGWVIILRAPGVKKRLAAGGWNVDGKRVTKRDAERVLVAMGLTPAN
jgi:hypothetical protein